MVEKAQSSSMLESEERWPLIREILGILLSLVAILVLLSLISLHNRQDWIGRYGATAAQSLVIVFGRYVAFVLPGLIGVCAFYLLRGASPTAIRGRGWLRGLGGLLILIATCALLPLVAAWSGPLGDERAFELGGVVGAFLLHEESLNLARLLGTTGASLLFGGLSLIGLVLFTESLLRELAQSGWSVLRAALRWVTKGRWTVWCENKAVQSLIHLPGAVLGAVRAFRPIGWLREYLGEVQFNRRRSHTMNERGGPILKLEPAVREELRPVAAPVRLERSRSTVMPRPVVTPPPAPAWDDDVPTATTGEQGVAIERPFLPKLHGAERAEPVQAEMELFPSEFRLPGLNLLVDPPATQYKMSEAEQRELSARIEGTLAQFKVEVEVVEVVQGPVITRFALRVAPGVRVNRILALESELAMALKAHHVRILAPIPGQSAVGIEVPNKRANSVNLKELIDTNEFRDHKSPLAFALGKNISGEAVVCDLAQMPHLLIAGATGSGKSVCLNTIIASLLYRNKPDQIKFVMIDPKRVELSIYQAIPHLWAPVVTEPRKASAALAWCVELMEERYKTLAAIGVRNIDGYNQLATSKKPEKKAMGHELKYMPHVVIIIDELADLMMVAKNEVEEYIIRLAQMARAIGMHLVLATQRPSVNVITGIIKANFPSRIAFQVSSKVDSRTILDLNGAEALMGRGDMLYSPGGVKPFRLQGAFVSDAEVERLADYIREQEKARYVKEDFEPKPTPAERAKAQRGLDEEDDYEDQPFDSAGSPGRMASHGRAGDAPLKPGDIETMNDEDLYDMALRLILESRKGSVSYIQRRLKIGYARAGRLMDMMEERGIVGPYQGSKPRDILVVPSEYLDALDGTTPAEDE